VIGRRLLIALAIVAGLLSGGIYYASAQRSPVVVAARDLDAIRPLTPDDLLVRAFPSDALPIGALSDPTQAIGRVPRAPLWRGQLVLAHAIGDTAAAFRSGLVPPAGTRAIALPVTAAQALGGAIAPGSRIDVVAVPIIGRAPAGRTTELLGSSMLVVDVRGEQGGAFVPPGTSRQPGGATAERIGSVVVAILPADELRFAERIFSSSFVLVLVPER